MYITYLCKGRSCKGTSTDPYNFHFEPVWMDHSFHRTRLAQLADCGRFDCHLDRQDGRQVALKTGTDNLIAS